MCYRNTPDSMELGDEPIPRCHVACQSDEGMLHKQNLRETNNETPTHPQQTDKNMSLNIDNAGNTWINYLPKSSKFFYKSKCLSATISTFLSA